MIVSLSELLVAMVVVSFTWIAVDWALDTLATRREAGQLRKGVRTCHLCGRSYSEDRRVTVSTCPECQGRNHRRGARKLG